MKLNNMTLKDLQEEGEKDINTRKHNWRQDFNFWEKDIKDFINSQISLAYELGRKDMLDEVLREIEGMYKPPLFSSGVAISEHYNLALDSLKEKLINLTNKR